MREPTALEAQWLEEGFAIWPARGHFVPSFAQIYYKPTIAAAGPGLIFRLEVAPAHCNGFDIAHGGFISTMADVWLANNVGHQLPKETRFVTSSLSVDFLRPVKAGQWIESEIDRIKLGGLLCHASGAILCDGKAIAAMRATFAVIG
ncbi:PaaI family thioesterase [Andreprevotia chitinilytica]|uniref:PaaI family thioesterase n=1 Tax=Andreprevotia chitinilytica TaxID=396808 RepID=UPI000691F39A|nr:PaaI family thioesterase [Andreprevotia chitinilytica]